jgi:hypothetical protein
MSTYQQWVDSYSEEDWEDVDMRAAFEAGEAAGRRQGLDDGTGCEHDNKGFGLWSSGNGNDCFGPLCSKCGRAVTIHFRALATPPAPEGESK